MQLIGENFPLRAVAPAFALWPLPGTGLGSRRVVPAQRTEAGGPALCRQSGVLPLRGLRLARYQGPPVQLLRGPGQPALRFEGAHSPLAPWGIPSVSLLQPTHGLL
jgi:hypothetical protein